LTYWIEVSGLITMMPLGALFSRVELNSSLDRSASSTCLRSVMSRTMLTKALGFPSASRMVEALSSTGK
jgi:hypothetical protein